MAPRAQQAWRLARSQGRRDQALATAGLTVLRFTHAQVIFEPERVVDTLRGVTPRLGAVRIPVR